MLECKGILLGRKGRKANIYSESVLVSYPRTLGQFAAKLPARKNCGIAELPNMITTRYIPRFSVLCRNQNDRNLVLQLCGKSSVKPNSHASETASKSNKCSPFGNLAHLEMKYMQAI